VCQPRNSRSPISPASATEAGSSSAPDIQEDSIGPPSHLPGFRWLFRLRMTVMRNRLGQLINQSPLKLLLVILFISIIWGSLYLVFDEAFRFMRRFEQSSAIAIPYVFHVFFVAMTALLAFSSAVLAYGALFSRKEPSFLLATPHSPRNVVAIMYIEALFFASWSLLLLGVPLMIAFGKVQGLPWYFYLTFMVSFLGFVPIPGALGLIVALSVAMWLPRQAKRVLMYAAAVAIGLLALWWGRLWVAASETSNTWLQSFLGELQYLKAALLPSTWVANAIRSAVENRPADAAFYLFVTVSTGLFFSWAAITFTGSRLLVAFGRAHAVTNKARTYSGRISRWLTDVAFFYAPPQMRTLILKDVRSFLRDPVQWSQLAILFGLLGLYLVYLPRSRPEGFDLPWKGLICFLNYGAVSLILSTFTSRFVFPMMSLEGRQIWLVALWPLPREKVMWAKFLFATTVTAIAAMSVTALSIHSLDLPWTLTIVQCCATLTTCLGLCGLAIGVGARLPSFNESNSGRIASGLGGTVNLIASVALVAASIVLFGLICYDMVGAGSLNRLGTAQGAALTMIMILGLGTCWLSMAMGVNSFRKQEF
jgi:ABC-2 type transport system permease protein